MDLTFYMTVNEEAALNKEIIVPITESIAFLSNRTNLSCTELLICTLLCVFVLVFFIVFSKLLLKFVFISSSLYSSEQTSSRKVLEIRFYDVVFLVPNLQKVK